jgi:hypothetical protein
MWGAGVISKGAVLTVILVIEFCFDNMMLDHVLRSLFIKNERDPPFFTGKLLIKFQKILRNTTHVIIRHRVKILFSVISSPITLEQQK